MSKMVVVKKKMPIQYHGMALRIRLLSIKLIHFRIPFLPTELWNTSGLKEFVKSGVLSPQFILRHLPGRLKYFYHNSYCV